jgi:hypothetical protein
MFFFAATRLPTGQEASSEYKPEKSVRKKSPPFFWHTNAVLSQRAPVTPPSPFRILPASMARAAPFGVYSLTGTLFSGPVRQSAQSPSLHVKHGFFSATAHGAS